MRSRPAGRRRSSDGWLAGSRGRRLLGLAALAAAALAAAGCGPAPPPGVLPTPTARRAPLAGYAGRLDSLPDPSARPLAGRRIAVDPGHGGSFRGALGVAGLTEAEVNLGVATRLASLLRAAGAEVLLTRETDRDFLTPADSSLRADLAERVRLANEWRPDVLLSIHHNADPGARHDVNETQVYHQLGEPGPALELAEDIHRSLTRNLGIEVSRLIPGNFFVLRHSEAPALLSEASHITYPPTEARLRAPAGQQLEAEALHLGLVRYFARRVPAIEGLRLTNAPAGDLPRIEHGRPVVEALVRGPYDDVEMRLDGQRVWPERRADQLRWSPAEALANGTHTLSVRARLAGEGTGRSASLSFRIDKPATRLVADVPQQTGWRAGQPLGMRLRAFDRDGLPLPEGAPIRVRAPAGMRPADTVVVVRGGEAWAYFVARPVPGRPEPARFRVSLEGGASARNLMFTVPPAPLDGARTAFLLVAPPDSTWKGVVPSEAKGWLNRDGLVTSGPSSEPWRQPALPGFRPAAADTAWPPRVVAIAEGALLGWRIALDPEGGGDDPAGVGPSGTRASSLNLQVAQALAAMLSASGAEVLLVRQSEDPVSEVTRVQLAEGFGAQRYLRIAHRAAPPSAGHYFSSGGGRRWAERLAALAPRLGLDSLAVDESARYPIAQVSAVALDASLARIDRDEARLLRPGALRAEAHALHAALAADLLGRDLDVEVRTLTAPDGTPLPHALARLGGVLLVQADARGEVRFARTESTPAPLESLDPPR